MTATQLSRESAFGYYRINTKKPPTVGKSMTASKVNQAAHFNDMKPIHFSDTNS